jgi:dipeptidyl aminopeptidase/acylaminoacyl peptidase
MFMRSLFIICLLYYFSLPVFGQKSFIDTSDFKAWPFATNGKISDNGRYVVYNVKNQPGKNNTLILSTTNGGWRKEISDALDGVFSADSKKVIISLPNNSLQIFSFEDSSSQDINNVLSFTCFNNKDSDWLIYQLKGMKKELIVHNLKTGTSDSFFNVVKYSVCENGGILLIDQIEASKDSQECYCLSQIKLPDVGSKIIFRGSQIEDFVFDKLGNQLAFSAEHMGERKDNDKSIWYYNDAMDSAELLVKKDLIDSSKEAGVDGILSFSEDGNELFFSIRDTSTDISPSRVSIWNSEDVRLPPVKAIEMAKHKAMPNLFSHWAVINLANRHILQLERGNETVVKNDFGKYIIVVHLDSDRDPMTEPWNLHLTSITYIQSIQTGERKILPIPSGVNGNSCVISPLGKYVIFYDPSNRNYFSYSIESGIERNITQNIQTSWVSAFFTHAYPLLVRPYGLAGWIKNDSGVIVYDENDIWQIDPEGKTPAICITRRYGKKNNSVLRFAINRDSAVQSDEEMLVSVFNRTSKKSGFLSIQVGGGHTPKLLMLGNYLCNSIISPGIPPVKAKNAPVYLIEKMTAAESPNYFVTTDFKGVKQLSEIYPEKRHYWMKAELVQWKAFDGHYLQGVMYKPENFKPSLKYPIIFYYYQELSDKLNAYLKPDFCVGPINIPWFVSRGYIIFCPDIQYGLEGPGPSAYNSIVSAAKCLGHIPWIDSKHMGIQGHSFGGYETNYLVTHTGLFAAAMSAAGSSDLISMYGSIGMGNNDNQTFLESEQGRMWTTLWKNPSLYIKNSPVFQADRVVTPILLMNNKKDGAVDYTQGVEFFMALRRLGKKAWMLQYDNAGHIVTMYDDQADFTIRLTQFFDHYLKGTSMPKWMLGETVYSEKSKLF